MNKGDTLQLTLNYKLNGVALEEDAYDEIELQLNAQTDSNSIKLLYSEGDLVWDETLSKYVAYLSQEDTFKLKEDRLDEDSEVRYQLRIYVNDSTGSQPVLGSFTLGPVLSKKVLGAD